jgi:peptidoglycan hydrolase CwlO-like protein
VSDAADQKRFGVRDVGIFASLILALAGIIHNASRESATSTATSVWHETRITKLEAWQGEVQDQLHEIDKKLDRIAEKLGAASPK